MKIKKDGKKMSLYGFMENDYDCNLLVLDAMSGINASPDFTMLGQTDRNEFYNKFFRASEKSGVELSSEVQDMKRAYMNSVNFERGIFN